MPSSHIILLCGKSGSGKDFIVKTLDLMQVVSHTTRPKRDYEIHGVHKFFHRKPCFVPDQKNLVAWTKRGPHYYWTLTSDLMSGNIYIIDVKGIQSILGNPNWDKYGFKVVYLDTPWWKRIRNMRKRGENWRSIIERLLIDYRDFKPLKSIKHETIKL